MSFSTEIIFDADFEILDDSSGLVVWEALDGEVRMMRISGHPLKGSIVELSRGVLLRIKGCEPL